MRDYALIGIVCALCVCGLIKPKIGVIGYVWFALLRPDVLAYSNPANSYSMMIAVCTLIGAVLHLGRFGLLFTSPLSAGLLLMQIPTAISAFSAVDPNLSLPQYWFYTRILAMSLLIPVFIDSIQAFRILFLVMAGSLGVIGLKFGLFGLAHGGVRFNSGYDNGMLSGNNEVGMALAMILPLCYYSVRTLQKRWQKVLMMVTSFSSAAAIIMTYSRGAALGLLAVALMIIWKSSRRLLALVFIVVLTGPVIYILGDSYIARLETIKAPTEEGSAASRIELSKLAFKMWQDYPLFGVGYGRENFRNLAPAYGYTGDGLVAHNTYSQVLVDSGVLAFGCYISLLVGSILFLGRSARRVSRSNPELAIYPEALKVSLVAFAITSTFGSRENFDLYYMLLMAAAAWLRIERTVLVSQTASQQHSEEPELIADRLTQAEAV